MCVKMAADSVSKLLSDWSRLCKEAGCENTGKDLPASKLKDFSDLSSSILEELDTNQSTQFVNDVCQQLIELFRSKRKQLCLVVLEFIPPLIWRYLSSKSKSLNSLEACLLTLYNLNLNFKQPVSGGLCCVTIPSLGRSSVYHEPSNLSSTILTESALTRHEQIDRKIPIGPFPQVEKLNAKTRLPVLSHLLRCYNEVVGLLSGASHKQLCYLAIKLSCSGFKTNLSVKLLQSQSKSSNTNLATRPRIPVSPELLCELIHGVYFIMFNGQPELGLEALESMHQRAIYELYSNVLLLTNAIKNSLEHNPSGQPYDGPMGVTISITPAHILDSLNKQAITNASFKAQKLPEDITPADGEDYTSDGEADHKNASQASGSDRQNKILRPIKTALKRVERSITQKREARDNTPSPAKTDKTDKVDGSTKVSKTPTAGKEKDKFSNSHEMSVLPAAAAPYIHTVPVMVGKGVQSHVITESSQEDLEYIDAVGNGDLEIDPSYHTVDLDRIEIVIDPPADDVTTVTKM